MTSDRTEPSDIVAATQGSGTTIARHAAAPTFQRRPVFVVIGMHRSGASVLSKMLQILGVDMAETSTDGAEPSWERPEIVAFNDRLLAIIGRPLASPVHSLPFPAGWWGDPRVLALKREVQAYLRVTLDGRYGLWGFKDLRVTRLLPFWTQVFAEMELHPHYLWTVRDPADCAASAVASGLVVNSEIAEAMWFIYNADAHKFVGDQATAVVDYTAWTDAPTDVIDMLLGRLPLTWNGSHGELLECVRAITSTRRALATTPPPIHSPLVRTFYEALRDADRSEKSMRYRGSVAQAVDILRTLVAPYAALVSGSGQVATALPAPPPPPPPVNPLSASAEPEALAAALARAEQAEAAMRETEEVLSREIEARLSENSWLTQQFLDGKRALAEQDQALRQAGAQANTEVARIRAETEAAAAEQRATAQKRLDELQSATDRQRRKVNEELDQLRRELATQKTANEKYLSRIYELKAMRKTDVVADPAAPAT